MPLRLPSWLQPGLPKTPELTLETGTTLPIHIRRLAHGKRLTLRLSRDGQRIQVTIPQYHSENEALRFVRNHTAWLSKIHAQIPPKAPPSPSSSIPFCGIDYTILHNPSAPRRPVLNAPNQEVCLGGPLDTISKRLQNWLRQQALIAIEDDLDFYKNRLLAQGHHLKKPLKLGLSSAQGRWGSCSAEGRILINWRLIMAPPMVRRSVVAHEVAHLRHLDHSPAFYTLLDALFEDSRKEADAWLKADRRTLYTYFG